ncbi:hypothetical protein TWF696_003961 [Orbilia brochopaga]|uniref:DNA repair protein rad9 n=1 Tax=Orbilia brochopaga TaxID=3140254 RepID=A0AAV9V5Z0_9PEZI
MSTLNITLSPLAVDRLYEALSCLAKFGDYVTLEARRNKLNLRTLNSTHSAHVLICVAGDTFCDAYNFVPDPSKLGDSPLFSSNGSQSSARVEEGAFVCKINVKALLPVFRGRYVQEAVNKERDESLVQGIEKCEISLHERENRVQCRLVIKLFCRHGVVKIFKLQYEEADIMYATFLKEWGVNRWTIRAGELKKWMEHFGPKAEHLDIGSEEDRANFTSFSEKIVDGAQILKHPLQTSIELDLIEFHEFQVARDTHIAINVKDFKAMVTHAGTLDQVQISAAYGEAGQPMQVTYDQNGMFCEFTLMTRKKGAAGPAGAGKAEPVAKIVMHRGTSAAAATSARAGSRETSAPPIKVQPQSSATRKVNTPTPGPSAGPLPSSASVHAAAPSIPPTASRAASSKSASGSAEMPPPPPPLRVTPRSGSVSAASDSSLSRGTPASARQPSLSLGFKGSLQPRPSQSLFLMDEDDDDDLFGPTPAGGVDDGIEGLLDDLDDDDVLGWDASLDSERVSFVELQERAVNADAGRKAAPAAEKQESEEGSYVGPTQRRDVVKGLFDD